MCCYVNSSLFARSSLGGGGGVVCAVVLTVESSLEAWRREGGMRTVILTAVFLLDVREREGAVHAVWRECGNFRLNPFVALADVVWHPRGFSC